jgi:hypothetical protein
MREKKGWIKQIPQEETITNLVSNNVQKANKEKAAAFKDDDLYKVNVDKTSLRAKREKLAADRFKEEERPYSKVEAEKLKVLEQRIIRKAEEAAAA